MIIIEAQFTGTDWPLDFPRIGAFPLTGTVTATTSAAGFDAAFAASPLTDRWWKPTAVPANWSLSFGGAAPVSYVGIAAHDCAAVGASLAVETWNGSSWIERAAVTPADNGPIMFLLERLEHTAARVVMSGAAAKLGVIYIGDVIEFPRRAVYAGSMPFNETIQSEFTTAITEGGQWVDRIEKRSAGSASMTVNNLSEMWQAEVIQPLLTFMQGAPVFIADRPEPFPLSVAYAFTSKRPMPARSIANALIARSLTLDLVSHVSA